MKNANTHDSPFKKFQLLSSEGRESEALALAYFIAHSNYPISLRKICSKYIQDNGNEKSLEPISTYAANLYAAIGEREGSAKEEFKWLPTRLISPSYNLAQREGEIPNERDDLALEFSRKGLDLLDLLNTVIHSETVKAIDKFFDHVHYITVHPDMQGKNRNEALEHYAIFGGREETREPNLLFKNSEFFEIYPWVKRVKINPLHLFSRWPQEFSQYAKIVQRRYNIVKSIGASSIPAFGKQSPTSHSKLSDSEEARILAVTREQSAKPRVVTPEQRDSLNIHVIIPDFTAGGGGHMTIFRMIKYLESAGNTCTVWVKGYNYLNHPMGASKSATLHYQTISAKVLPLSAHYAFATGDAIIATSWDTVEIALANKNFIDHFYLVQDYEPFFYARGTQALKAERTYSLNIKTICASTWLHEIMKTKFGRHSVHFALAFNPNIYYPQKPKPANNAIVSKNSNGMATADKYSQNTGRPVVRIAFYARTRTERRAVELAIEGLRLVEQKDYDLCVELFGEDRGRVKLSNNVTAIDHGILSPNELAHLYRTCDIGLTFSATNYALVPQEMMACGLPVIEIDNDSTRAIYPADALWLADPSASSIANAIETLAENRETRERIAKNGMDWVSKHSWEQSFMAVEQFLKTEVNMPRDMQTPNSSSQYYKSLPHRVIRDSTVKDPLATIVIPTLNGGAMFLDSAAIVLSQAFDHNYELLIVDSVSDDGTIDQLPHDPRLAVYEVSRESFQHGRTRNLAISLAKGQYIAFLTQDAIPLNQDWLSNLIQPFVESEEVVAAFGRHKAHISHSSSTEKMLDAHFKSFTELGSHNISSQLNEYWAEHPGFRQIMHYYSDNNSCLRKSFWEAHPYPDIDYGEDQLFADWIAQNELTKTYVHDAVVLHSHQYTYEEEFRRCKTEAYFFAKFFGYDLSQTRFEIETGIRDESASLLAAYGKSLDNSELTNMLANIRAKREGYLSGIALFWQWLDQSSRNS